ncbi:MAG TPA: energy transducer TonB [Anaeromyxobacteraceae bacterium]|nr:energy transducer TonB [Anaeromyxobacteraceae bacterium]
MAARPADLTAVRSGVFRTLRYPDEARRRRLQGRVELEFVLLADGRVRELGVRSSSGHGILDGAAVSAIESAAPFDPPGMDVVVVLPVSFRGD